LKESSGRNSRQCSTFSHAFGNSISKHMLLTTGYKTGTGRKVRAVGKDRSEKTVGDKVSRVLVFTGLFFYLRLTNGHL